MGGVDAVSFEPLWPYWGVLTAAIVEGEIAYITAAVLVAHGQLNPMGVLVSGAVGAAAGDQIYFYLFRGRLRRWMARYPPPQPRPAPLLWCGPPTRRSTGVFVRLCA